MIKIENTKVVGFDQAVVAMRHPHNSWDKNDSEFKYESWHDMSGGTFEIGPNDHDLMMRLANGGPVHATYRRMIGVYLTITAPLYWWKEMDRYSVGKSQISCSTMHKIHEKEFTLEDFSCEHLVDFSLNILGDLIAQLNYWRNRYLVACKTEEETDLLAKDIWWQMIQLLPSSYNQKRTVYLSYEVLANIYEWRKDHKLDEWRELCKWIESLPYSEIITEPVQGKKWLMDELSAAQKQILELEEEIHALRKKLYEAGIEE